MRSNSATGSSSSADVNWAEINPTIFGAVFESTLSTVMRRKNGMHYTTVKNIHRVADPLCLWALEHELDEIAAVQNLKTRNAKLIDFQKKLGELLFLDPACGSGNFLTETYPDFPRSPSRRTWKVGLVLTPKVGKRTLHYRSARLRAIRPIPSGCLMTMVRRRLRGTSTDI